MAIPLRVLIIEDSDSDAALDIRVLEKAGYKVTYEIVTTAKEMKAALDKQTFDLIISDHNLPQFDSMKALNLLKESGQDIPFIVVSGTIGEETAVKIMQAGAHDYIMKNNLTRLGTAVERELREVEVRHKQKRTEEALGESEKRYRTVVQDQTDIICRFNPDDTLIFANDVYCSLFGKSKDELVGQKWSSVAHPEDLEMIHEKLKTISPSNQVVIIESRVLSGKGDVRWMQFINRGSYDQQGTLLEIQSVGRDITEYKQMVEKLKNGSNLNKLILDSAGEGILGLDIQGNHTFTNRAAAKMLGYEVDELIGKNSHSTWHYKKPDGSPYSKEECPIYKVLQDGAVSRVDNEVFWKKDGTNFPVEYASTPIQEEDKVTGTVVTFNDITKRRQANEEKEKRAAELIIANKELVFQNEEKEKRAAELSAAEVRLKESYAKLQSALKGVIAATGQMLESKDPYTAGHQKRVATLARAIASEMHLSEDVIEGISLASLIHDIGKISVPSDILNKPGRISEAEFIIIKEHPRTSFEILKDMQFPWPIAQITFQHHERLDGSGYPQKLSNGDILLEARIIGVADVVEAMASHRPYRPALGIDKALDEIAKNRGKLYDTDVVDACMKLFREKGFKLE